VVEDRPPGIATVAVHGGGAASTIEAVEQRIALLEGGTAAVATAAGPPLLTLALQPLMRPGDQLIAARQLSRRLREPLSAAVGGFGWDVQLADIDGHSEFERAVSPKTQAIIIPSVTASGEVADIAVFASLGKRAGVPLIVDNTPATPALGRPFDFGADIVLHADTRFLAGEETGMGVIVDGGRFNWLASRRYPFLSEKREDGEAIAEAVGNFAYAQACRFLAGAAHDRDDVRRIAAGLETLSLRMARQSETARAVSEYLSGHRRVATVSYPGLRGDRHHMLAEKYMPRGAGALVAFTVEGGEDAASALCNALHLIAPRREASTARSTLGLLADLIESVPGTLVLTIGLEDATDLIADLDQALTPP
jgi:O-acetylhomoserine (thiol)-lyase